MPTPLVAPEFDPQLIARYDAAGAHCASYPPVAQFRADFDERALHAAIRASNEEPIPRPLSLYVHVPFGVGPCFYCGCNRVVTSDPAHSGRYLERLYREMEMLSPLFDRDRPVSQLHLGGGTPSFLDLASVRELMESLGRHFSFSMDSEREYDIEVDPRYADAAQVRGLAQLGFNRLTIGVADFDPAVQRAVERVQSIEQTQAVVAAAREAGFRSISINLIHGLPLQTAQTFARTLDAVIAWAPDRVAALGYTRLPHASSAPSAEQELPDAAARLALFGSAVQRLTDAGYVYLGMDRFARADDALVQAQRAGTLQHDFLGYSTRDECDVVGLGVSAMARIGDTYSQNARDLLSYYAALDAGRLPVACGLQLDEDDVIRRELMRALICRGVLDKATFGARHRLRFDEYFAAERHRLRPLIADGLVQEDARAVRVTSRGRLLLRIIVMCFDAFQGRRAPAARHLRVI